MKKRFYSEIVTLESLVIELDKLELSKAEKEHLLAVADEALYHTILDAILSELSDQDKKIFLEHVTDENDEKVWNLLHGKIENIETKIKLAAEQLTKELHKDIKETKEN